jgi:hypothetical protein
MAIDHEVALLRFFWEQWFQEKIKIEDRVLSLKEAISLNLISQVF